MKSYALLLALALVPACKPKKAAEAPVVRPVLSTVVAKNRGGDASFVGSIEPRYSTDLAFRVGGRVTRRAVSVGDSVKKGDVIATLDTQSLGLAVKAAEANVAGVRATSTNAVTTLERQSALLARKTATQSAFDDARLSQDTANATVAEAEARLAKSREDLGYGVLRADFDGVITKIDFEVEQTVAPNSVIATLARPGVLDDVFDVPESVAKDLDVGSPFTVHDTATPPTMLHGTIRQLSPSAERTTRTRRVWVALDGAPADLRFGTTTYAEREAKENAPIRIPVTALLEAGGKTSVWVVTGDTVESRAVTIGARTPVTLVVESGLEDGERVVTAGVHALAPGQHVKILEDERS